MNSAIATSQAISTNRSQGAWVLAWTRFKRDKVGVLSAWIVLSFIALALITGFGWLAQDWQQQKAVGFAPPSLFKGQPKEAASVDQAQKPGTAYVAQNNEYDPIASVLAQLRGGFAIGTSNQSEHGIVDPLAQILAELRGPVVDAQNVVLANHLPFGADKWGRDVLAKVIKGTQVSLFVGLASALVATFIGTLFGALAGFFGGKTDLFFNWLYSVFNAIPNILMVLAIAAVLQSRGIGTVVLILGLTGWSAVFRLVRAEYLKHRTRDYVRAADAIGATDFRKMFVHILPNISHVILVNLSLLVVLFIKSEVILSFLGFGVPVDTVSWGSMLNEAQNELILGYWWQLAAATTFMAVLVTAFSLFTDALRDALDPKLK
jgi:peptide/nickel transport system permease protein